MTNNVTQFDLSSFAASAPSICIPRVFPNITERRVWAIFENLGFGEVEKIDMIERTSKSGDSFKRVFVHFVAWNDSEEARVVRQKLLGEEEVKVVYDEPWYWLLSASKSVRPENRVQRKRRPRPYVDFTASGQQKQQHRSQTGSAAAAAKAAAEAEELRRIRASRRRPLPFGATYPPTRVSIPCGDGSKDANGEWVGAEDCAAQEALKSQVTTEAKLAVREELQEAASRTHRRSTSMSPKTRKLFLKTAALLPPKAASDDGSGNT